MKILKENIGETLENTTLQWMEWFQFFYCFILQMSKQVETNKI